MSEPIITSLLDLDLYKITVHQVIFSRFPTLTGEYRFTCRNKDQVDLLRYVPLEELQEQIAYLSNLALSESEYQWLKLKKFIKPAYAEFLRNFRFNPAEHITIETDKANNTYSIVAAGPLVSVMLYETLVLCIVNELFERNYTAVNGTPLEAEQIGLARLRTKLARIDAYNSACQQQNLPTIDIIEFGTRRRYSKAWQKTVLQEFLHKCDNIIGTSNVRLAMDEGLTPIGTFGHEYVMAMQGLFPVQHSQKRALEIWQEEYRGVFGIALSDTLGDDKFDKDFDFLLAKSYDGTRHDSGDPFDYGDRRIKHYQQFSINAKVKKIVFSDGLDIPTAIALHRYFQDRIKTSFGIGTNLTESLTLGSPEGAGTLLLGSAAP